MKQTDKTCEVEKRPLKLVFGITYKCNIKCRHCCADNGDIQVPDPLHTDLLRWLNCLPRERVEMVCFGGGEPFLKYHDLIEYCKILKEKSISAATLTNGFWGKNKEHAVNMLQKIDGLKSIFISVDQFHQESISDEVIENSIDAVLKTGKYLLLKSTHISSEDKKNQQRKYAKYFPRVMTVSSRLMTAGAAGALSVEKFTLKNNPEQFGKDCTIGDLFVNHTGGVYLCCPTANQGKDSLNPFYLGNIDEDGWDTIFQNAGKNRILSSVLKRGPIFLVDLFKETPYYDELLNVEFYSECDMCYHLFKDEDKVSILNKYLKSNMNTKTETMGI